MSLRKEDYSYCFRYWNPKPFECCHFATVYWLSTYSLCIFQERMKNVHLRPTVLATWNVAKVNASEKQKKQRENLSLRRPEKVSM